MVIFVVLLVCLLVLVAVVRSRRKRQQSTSNQAVTVNETFTYPGAPRASENGGDERLYHSLEASSRTGPNVYLQPVAGVDKVDEHRYHALGPPEKSGSEYLRPSPVAEHRYQAVGPPQRENLYAIPSEGASEKVENEYLAPQRSSKPSNDYANPLNLYGESPPIQAAEFNAVYDSASVYATAGSVEPTYFAASASTVAVLHDDNNAMYQLTNSPESTYELARATTDEGPMYDHATAGFGGGTATYDLAQAQSAGGHDDEEV